MTLTKFRFICLIVFLVIYISAVIFLPINVLMSILFPIAGWQIGGWVSDLSNKLASKYGYID